MYVLSKTRRVCSNCHGVFNFCRLVKILVEYLAIFVVYLVNPFLSSYCEFCRKFSRVFNLSIRL